MPNPYPLPGKPYSLNHLSTPTRRVSADDLSTCIREAQQQITQHIHDEGDGPLPQIPDFFSQRHGTAIFTVARLPTAPFGSYLMYSDSIEILVTMSLIVERNDYASTYAEIILNDNFEGIGVATLGETIA